MNIYRSRLLLSAALVAGIGAGLMINLPTGSRSVRAADDSSISTSPGAWKELVDDSGFKAMLSSQIDVIEKSIKSSGTFRRALKKMQVTGQIVAILGNLDVYRLEGDAAKKAAALRDAGLALAKAADDKNFDDAKTAFDSIKAYPDSIEPAAEGMPTPWPDLVDIDGLMLGVSTADNETKKAVASSDLKKAAKEAEPYALLLACLGTAAREYEADDDWKGWCDDMRKESADLAKALSSRDGAAAKSARDAVMKSCKDCHEAYRVEE